METETEIIFYAVKLYIPFFFTANTGADAAVTKFSLYKKLEMFSQVSKELADEALTNLSCHLWFLAPTTVLFSLVSEKLEDDDKSRIVVKLLQLSKPKEMNKGLPTFPKMSEKT